MAILLKIGADRTRFDREINARFRTFQIQASHSADVVAGGLEREVDSIVRSGLTRAENRGRHQGSSLALAIKESINPYAIGRKKYGVGVRVTDAATLSRMAVYWHAIEVGSRHVVDANTLVVGFGVRRGSLFSGNLTPPAGRGFQPDAIASKTVGVVVRNPITAHRYLETISQRAASRFSARIGVDLQRSFS